MCARPARGSGLADCQVVAFAAAPFVLCNGYNVMSDVASRHDCDPRHHHHGQPAEQTASHEHHHHESQPATTTNAAIDCRCTVSDEFVLDTTVVTARVVLPDYVAPTRSHSIDTPIPRA